jgi:hypothetical protein
MNGTKTSLERAFELAASGSCRTVEEIRYKLRSEGYREKDVAGPSLFKQLKALITKARDDAQRFKGTKLPT